MKMKWGMLMVLATLVAVLAATGCAKKKTEAQPQAVVIEDTTPLTQPEPYTPTDDDREEYEAAVAEMGKPIYFDFDKSDIRSGEDKDRMQNKSVIMQRFDRMSIVVEGNCDERGTNEYNMALGSRRAGSAKAYLKNLGVDPSRVETVSYGEERPVDPGHNESAWSKNRRDDFVVR